VNEHEILENVNDNADLIRELTGYPIQRITQDKSQRFRRELRDKIKKSMNFLVRTGYLKEDGSLSEKSLRLYASKIAQWAEKELEGIYGSGRHISKERGTDEVVLSKYYGIGDKYSEISAKKSIRSFIKKRKLTVDKKVQRKGGRFVVLLDISGSMYGEKIYEAKKALLALISKVIETGDKLTVVLFNDKIVYKFSSDQNIYNALSKVLSAQAIGSTDIALALSEALKSIDERAHIVLITDALPTFGENPIESAISLASKIYDSGSTLSVVGIKLNEEGIENAKRLVKAGGGNLYIVKSVKELSSIVLADYLLFRSKSKEK